MCLEARRCLRWTRTPHYIWVEGGNGTDTTFAAGGRAGARRGGGSIKPPGRRRGVLRASAGRRLGGWGGLDRVLS